MRAAREDGGNVQSWLTLARGVDSNSRSKGALPHKQDGARKVLGHERETVREIAAMNFPPKPRHTPAGAYHSLLGLVAGSIAMGCSGNVVPTKSGSAGASAISGSASANGSGAGASATSGSASGNGSGAGYCSGNDLLGGNCTVGAGGASSGGTGGAATAGGTSSCPGTPPDGVCANGVTSAGTYTLVNGQCVVEYNCPASAGCQPGAACAPGFVCEESPGAGCGLGCRCTTSGYFDCSSDCPSPGGAIDASVVPSVDGGQCICDETVPQDGGDALDADSVDGSTPPR